MRRIRTWLVAAVVATSLAVVGLPVSPASAQDVPEDTTSATDDKSVSVPTGWWTYFNVTGAQVTNLLQKNGARLTDVEVYDASTPTFAVTMVRNAGAYAAPGWWWYYGLTPAQVGQLLSQNSARLIDLEPYLVNGVTRYAVVMVSNTGSYARAWWWYVGVSTAQVSSFLSNNNARLIDVESYVEGGVKKYAVVMVRNTGSDAKSWQWWVGQSWAGVASRVSAFGGRIVSLQRASDGTYNLIQVKNAGSDNKAWWYYDTSSLGNAVTLAGQNAARIFDVETYLTRSGRRWLVVMIDNADAETRRIRSIMAPTFSPGGVPKANYGAYSKRVGGGVVVGLQPHRIFEPASSIKALHLLTSMRRVQAGTDSLPSSFTYYNYPSSTQPNPKDACPNPSEEVAANAQTATLGNGLSWMMKNSDNRTTRGTVLRYGGFAPFNQVADIAAMTRTELRHNVGCAGPQPNDLTLGDIGRLYEGVQNAALLNAANRTAFFGRMSGGQGAANISDAIENIVQEEATKQGKQAVVSQFISNMVNHAKGGSYDTGATGGYTYTRTGAGRISIPAKSGSVIVHRHYVYGTYVDDYVITCSGECSQKVNADNAIRKANAELHRSTIAAALKTW